ncbi:hypothetical protein [Shewanella atlantica]|uniref:J domain-containing protein n=1 Tax=Shewanella atlantica TaxID=271099 RepID=A0A3S0IKH0_9GAMM|nr:hypothetical protein [Shewanella atlantica]RTR26082.1 hypothetical protein EKG39_22465 [Shewanella atlantica]
MRVDMTVYMAKKLLQLPDGASKEDLHKCYKRALSIYQSGKSMKCKKTAQLLRQAMDFLIKETSLFSGQSTLTETLKTHRDTRSRLNIEDRRIF